MVAAMRPLREVIEAARSLREPGQWCSEDKEDALIALVYGLRPKLVVEIGVWRGGSAIPLALALRETGGQLMAIDPWANVFSVKGQTGDHEKWWSEVNHEDAYERFVRVLKEQELEQTVTVVRASSSHALVHPNIDLLHVDGNHAEQAITDVSRFAPAVSRGGIVVMDDLHWPGGHVTKAAELLITHGFSELYPVDTSVVFQRRR